MTQAILNVGFGTTIREDCSIGEGTRIWHFCNLYGCRIGKNCKIASFVEIGNDVNIGDNCKIEAYTFIPQGVTIGDNVFIGPHTCFTNDKFPRASIETWKVCRTFVKDGASIGANSTILSGIVVGEKAMVGAGSIVTKDVADGALVYGDGAKERGTIH